MSIQIIRYYFFQPLVIDPINQDLRIESKPLEYRDIPMQQTVPLFPLSAHLLPGGKLPLRIFEPRYVTMVKDACANNSGFGICMLNPQGDIGSNKHIFPIGTYAKVVDFDLLPDGMLGITVEGMYCFNILAIQTEKNGLRIGECEVLHEWQASADTSVLGALTERLQEIFDKYPELQSLHPLPRFDDPIWVIYRWLELLPIEPKEKQALLTHKEHVKALEFLTQLIE